MPGVGLAAGKARAVDTGLLPRADADGLPVHRVAHGVRLGVFQRDERNEQVAARTLGQVGVLCHKLFKKRPVDAAVVMPLLKRHTEHLLALERGGFISGIDLHNVVAALALGAQDLKRLRLIARSNDAVGHLALDELRRCHVAHIRQGDPVAKGAHAVRAAGAGIGAGKGRIVQSLNVRNEAGALELFRQRQPQCRTRRADVLERGRAGQPRRSTQFAHKLPRIECVKKVDISRTAAEDLHRQLRAALHIDAGRLLVRVAAVFQFKFLHKWLSFPI